MKTKIILVLKTLLLLPIRYLGQVAGIIFTALAAGFLAGEKSVERLAQDGLNEFKPKDSSK
jgi:hypothetical protein